MQSNLAKRIGIRFALVGMWLVPSICLADTVVTFNETSTYTDGTQLLGTVQFDQTTGLFGTANVTGTFRGQPVAFTTNPALGYRSGYDELNYNALYFTGDFGIEWSLAIPVGNKFGAPGYSGGAICSIDNPCPGNSYLLQYTGGSATGPNAVSGSLTLVSPSAAPEPSSLWLMSTGVGLLGWVRRSSRKTSR